jgi:Na+-driven multidrug efflux pump
VNKLFLFFAVFVILIYFITKPFVKLWTQKDLELSESLLIMVSIFVLVRVYGIIYMNFLNAIGTIKLQMWLYLFGALINIPLSIFFVKNMNLGSSGVVLGTILSILALSIALPIQTFKKLRKI